MRFSAVPRAWFAATFVASLASIVVTTPPVTAGTASISGLVVVNPSRSVLEGAVVSAMDRDSNSLYRSAPTDSQGNFRLEGLPPGRYALAVEVEQGVFLSDSAVPLRSGESRSVHVAVSRESDRDPAGGATTARAKGGPWDNPVTATLIVIGGAIVVGLLLQEAGESGDGPSVSPMSPS